MGGREATRVCLTQVVTLTGVVRRKGPDGHRASLVIEGDRRCSHLRAQGLGATAIRHVSQPRHAAWLAWGHASERTR